MNSTSYTDTDQLKAILDATIGVSYYIYSIFVSIPYNKAYDAFFHYESLAIVN